MTTPHDIVLGIDLGTTFSAMAVVNRYGKPEILVNAEGHPTTPSVIHFYDVDGVVVGDEAVKMCVLEPEHVVRFIKRSMGEEGFELEFFGEVYTPQEMSALILRKLKHDAEALLGVPVSDVVITVPAYFNSSQRGATVEAGAIAGLNVLSVINEPTAAAIAYGIDKLGGERQLLVFDLGGGTFDVTVMKVEGHKLTTLASDGNAELGGKDWDDRLVNYVAEQFAAEHGLDPRDEPIAFQELYERCLAAKISLSTKAQALVPVIYQGRRSAVRVTRAHFEELTSDLVQQCVETVDLVLEKAGKGWSDISEVLLVGGATRMPMIREAIATASGKVPVADLNPDECVAIGAALAGVIRYRPHHPAFSPVSPEAREPAPLPLPTAAPARSAAGAPSAERFVSPVSPPRRQVSALAIGLADGGSPAVRHTPSETPGLGDASLMAGPPAAPAPSTATPSSVPRTDVQPEPESTPEQPIYALPGDIDIQDATTHPLGIIVLDRNRRERVVPLIAEGTPLPCDFHGRFAYAYENMRAVRVEVTEGHGSYRDEVSVIGRVDLTGLPPRPKGTPIDVIYHYGVDQILSVQVIDIETGQSIESRIRFAGGLDDSVGVDPDDPNVHRAGGAALAAARMRNRKIRVDPDR